MPTRLRSAAPLMAVLLAACASALPEPRAEDAAWATTEWPEATTQSLTVGRSLYVRRCSGCHALVVPGAHPATDWFAVVASMEARAHLKPGESQLIARYLTTAARVR